MATKDLDFGNVIKQVYDPATESLKVLVTLTIGSVTVDLDASSDSVRLGDGVILSTFTTVGPKNALDVNIAGGNLTITVDHTEDSIRLGNGAVLFTGSTRGAKAGLDVNTLNLVFSKPFDKLSVLTKNDDGDPLTIQSSYLGTGIQLGTIIYDVDGDFQDITVADL